MTMNNQTNKNESGINLLDLFMYLASKWKWFLLSVLICGGLAWLKYANTPFVYFRQATVIIKDPSNKTSSAGLDQFSVEKAYIVRYFTPSSCAALQISSTRLLPCI